MPRRTTTKNVCIITTSKSPSILQSSSSSSNANSSIQILDPQTGSILSSSSSSSSSNVVNDNSHSHNDGSSSSGSGSGSGSGSNNSSATIRITSGAGVHSIQPIQLVHSSLLSTSRSSNQHLYIAYGNQQKNFKNNQNEHHQNGQQQGHNNTNTNTNRLHLSDDNSDMYAYLLVQGQDGSSSSSSSSSPKWKCKLPEYMTGKLIPSPCGNYIIGGGKSGTCYCWSTMSTSTSTTTAITSNATTMNDNGETDDGRNNGSELVCKWVAHYRSIQSIIFSDCGSYIITGGDDGIVNVWTLMDVVSSSSSSSYSYSSSSSSSSSSSIHPIQTWSEHHLPITSMHTLPSSRIVSTSNDKQVVIMELFNGRTIAKIQMNSCITEVISDDMGYRLYLGSIDGTIYCIDLNAFAIATTAESASVVGNCNSTTNNNNVNVNARGEKASLSGSLLGETVLGMNSGNDNTAAELSSASASSSSSSASHISELRGHNSQISCLALFEENDTIHTTLLVSGSVDGSIRIWDMRSRCCTRTIYPWSSNSGGILGQQESSKNGKASSSSSSSAAVFPCSSLTVIPREWIENSSDDNDGSIFRSNSDNSGGRRLNRRKRKAQSKSCSLASLIKPLQRFTRRELQMDDYNNGDGGCGNNGFVMAFTNPIKEDKLEVLEDVKCYEDLDSRVSSSTTSGRNNGGKRIRIVIEDSKNSNKKNELEKGGKDGGKGKTSNSRDTDTGSTSTCDTKDTDPTSKNKDNDCSNLNDTKEKEEMIKEMNQLREEVARWQKVNNKLLMKLKKATTR